MAKSKANYTVELKQCTKCGKSKFLFEFWKDCAQCKECLSKARKKYYHDNKKKIQAKQKEWAKNNKKLRKLQNQRYWQGLKEKVFNHYGNKCACCGEDVFQFLTIDHINGNGTKHRKKVGSAFYRWLIKNNFPNDFQTLCFNCNFGKYINGGICPHKIK